MPFFDYFKSIRPLYYAILNIETQIFGPDPFPFHLITLLYHLANAALIYVILRRILRLSGKAKLSATENFWYPFAAALLYLLHPLQTESAAYIASRSETMSVFFAWCALLLYLGGAPDRTEPLRLLGVLALLIPGLLVKEHVAALPVVFLLVDYYFRPGFSWAGLKQRWLFYLPLALGGGGFVSYLVLKSGETTIGAGTGITPWQYLLTQGKVIWLYLILFVLPFKQNLDWAFPPVRNFSDPIAWLGLLSLAAATVLAWIRRKRFPLASLGWLVFLVLLAPTSSILPIADTMAERRLYLPMLGLLLILLEVFRRIPWTPLAASCVAAILCVCLALTYQRSAKFADPVALWTNSIEANPDNGRAWFNLAMAQYEAGDCQPAAATFDRAARLYPNDYRLLANWALVLDCAGRLPEAVSKIELALAKEDHPQGWATLGMLRAKSNQPVAALEAIDRALRLQPGFAPALFYRGNVYLSQGQAAQAAQAYQEAVSADPQNRTYIEALNNARRALAGPAPR